LEIITKRDLTQLVFTYLKVEK